MSDRLKRNALCPCLLAKTDTALARAIIEKGSENLVRSLCECAHNILKGNVPLKKNQKRRLRRYKGGLASFGSPSHFLPHWLLACFSRKNSDMEYAKKMALVDPRMLDPVPSQPLSTNPIGNIMRRLDDEMRFSLDRGDLNDREKVVLYNQVLMRYNLFSNKARQQPVRVTIGKAPVKEDEEDKESRAELGVEYEIIDSVPKSLKQKARRLLDTINGTMSWNDRGEMLYRNAPVPGSNIVDLVNDALRKRKSFQPVGWKTFARRLHDVNAPMDLVGNPECWIYIQMTTPSVAGGASKETTAIVVVVVVVVVVAPISCLHHHSFATHAMVSVLNNRALHHGVITPWLVA